MYQQLPTNRMPLLLGVIIIAGCILLFRSGNTGRSFISPWPGPMQVSAQSQVEAIAANTEAIATDVGGITGAVGLIDTTEQIASVAALEAYSQGSALQEAVADNRVQYFRRDLPGGSMSYFVVQLGGPVHVEVLNADGATPGSDASGDTIWTDGQKHLATVQEIANAPYAAREGMTLLGAMAFGFHGDARTSNEGTVVINGTIHRVNAGRGTLCITADGRAEIGLFTTEQLAQCAQAVGGGPVLVWENKVVSTDVAAPTDEFLPFNPLNEDFVQLDWRKMIYNGSYPKTAIGVGTNPDGTSYLVMAVSYGINGVEFAQQLKAMGCTSALGGDDDTSTQATWRGAPVRAGNVREVPDAVAVYVRS